MSTTPTLTSSECPNCGASIDLGKVADGQTQIECEYCGSVLNLPKPERLHEIQAQPIVIKVGEPQAMATPGKPAKTSGAGCATMFTLSVAMIILGIIAVVFWQAGALGSVGVSTSNNNVLSSLIPGARVFGSPVPLERVNDGAQHVAYLTLADKATHVVNVDITKQAEQWRSKAFSDRFTDIAMVSDAEHVYVADQDQLVALKRDTGEVAWELTLPYDISTDYQCRFNPCLRLFGSSLVARLKDGTLQAVAGATGKPLWSKSLNYTSGGVYDALGNPAIVDTDDGKNSAATFYVFDAGTGEETSAIAPECIPDRGTSSIRPDYPFASDDWVISPDGKWLIVVSDGSSPCAWKFDLAAGSEAWRYTADRNAAPEDKLPFMKQDPILVSDEGVYISGTGSDAVMNRLDMQTGAFSMLFTDTRHRIEPALAHAGLVYVMATPNFDSNKHELWAFDALTGQKKWQMSLKVSHAFDKWLLQPSDAGLFLVQTMWEDDKVQFDVINPQTGLNVNTITREMTNPSLTGHAFDRNTAWLNISGALHEVDMNTGEVKSTWP